MLEGLKNLNSAKVNSSSKSKRQSMSDLSEIESQESISKKRLSVLQFELQKCKLDETVANASLEKLLTDIKKESPLDSNTTLGSEDVN